MTDTPEQTLLRISLYEHGSENLNPLTNATIPAAPSANPSTHTMGFFINAAMEESRNGQLKQYHCYAKRLGVQRRLISLMFKLSSFLLNIGLFPDRMLPVSCHTTPIFFCKSSITCLGGFSPRSFRSPSSFSFCNSYR